MTGETYHEICTYRDGVLQSCYNRVEPSHCGAWLQQKIGCQEANAVAVLLIGLAILYMVYRNWVKPSEDDDDIEEGDE